MKNHCLKLHLRVAELNNSLTPILITNKKYKFIIYYIKKKLQSPYNFRKKVEIQ